MKYLSYREEENYSKHRINQYGIDMVEVCIAAALRELNCTVHSPLYSMLGSLLKQVQSCVSLG